MEVQVHVPQPAGRGHPPGAQGGIARCSSKGGEDLLHLAARHVLDQDLLAGVPDRECRDPAAVAEHRDPLAELQDLIQPVGDVKERDARLFEIADDHHVSLVQEDPGAVDRVDLPEVRDERGIFAVRIPKLEIDLYVRVAVESARVVDIEPI